MKSKLNKPNIKEKIPESSIGTIPTVFDSMKAAAAATKIPLSKFKQAKAAGCPAFKSNRVDIIKFLEWTFTQDGTGTVWREEFEMWHAKREKMRHDKEAKVITSRTDVEFGLSKIMAVLFNELDRMRQECPPSFKGRDEQAIFAEFGKRIDGLKAELRLKFAALAEGKE